MINNAVQRTTIGIITIILVNEIKDKAYTSPDISFHFCEIQCKYRLLGMLLLNRAEFTLMTLLWAATKHQWTISN